MYNIFWQNTIRFRVNYYFTSTVIYLISNILFTAIYVIILNKYKFEQFIVTDKITERKSVQLHNCTRNLTCK